MFEVSCFIWMLIALEELKLWTKGKAESLESISLEEKFSSIEVVKFGDHLH